MHDSGPKWALEQACLGAMDRGLDWHDLEAAWNAAKGHLAEIRNNERERAEYERLKAKFENLDPKAGHPSY